MSRQITFRGKRIDNGQWTYGDLIQLLGDQGKGRKFIVDNRFGACIDNEGNFVNTEAAFVNEVDPETVGQSTGMSDRNGKEVYEGDIVKTERISYTESGHYEGMIEVFGKVVYSNGSFRLHMTTGALPELTFGLNYHEIRGNIYTHPHLMEVSNT